MIRPGFKVALLNFFLILFTTGLGKSQSTNDWTGFYPESYTRQVAITRTMPIYPLDAVQRGIMGVVQAKFAIDDQGAVAKIKIHPGVDPLLKQAVADAVSKWTFKLRPEVMVKGQFSLSRLTFKFSINGTEPLVELYDPGPAPRDTDHLGYWNGTKERIDWNKWEEVKATKNQN